MINEVFTYNSERTDFKLLVKPAKLINKVKPKKTFVASLHQYCRPILQENQKTVPE